MAQIKKQASEKFPIGASIYKVQDTGETINLGASTIVAEDKDGTDVTTTLLDSTTKALNNDDRGGSNNILQIKVQGGVEASSPYKVTYTITTSLGNVYEVDQTVTVKET